MPLASTKQDQRRILAGEDDEVLQHVAFFRDALEGVKESEHRTMTQTREGEAMTSAPHQRRRLDAGVISPLKTWNVFAGGGLAVGHLRSSDDGAFSESSVRSYSSLSTTSRKSFRFVVHPKLHEPACFAPWHQNLATLAARARGFRKHPGTARIWSRRHAHKGKARSHQDHRQIHRA